jgi:hypothetical protein
VEAGSALNLQWFIKTIATEHRQFMKNNKMVILAGDFFDYTPTDFLATLRQPQFKDIFKGVVLEGLRIEGSRFDENVTDAQKEKWWASVQKTITYLGFVIDRDTTIFVEPLKVQSHLNNPDWLPVDRTYLEFSGN